MLYMFFEMYQQYACFYPIRSLLILHGKSPNKSDRGKLGRSQISTQDKSTPYKPP